MKNLLKKIGIGDTTIREKYTREDIIFWGVVALFFLFIATIFIDTYVFYKTILQKRDHTAPITALAFPQEEMDKLVHILDMRAQEFERILGK